MNQHALKDIDYHNEVASKYDYTIVAPRKLTNDVVYSKLLRKLPSGERMLDLGCGTGHLTSRVGKRFKEVFAVDHSKGMLNIAKQNIEQSKLKNVSFIEKDAVEFVKSSPDQTFDLVGCVGFLHHLEAESIKEILGHTHRSLKVGGYAIFQEPIVIDPKSIPSSISKWNVDAITARMDYSSSVPIPNEKPLEKEQFLGMLTEIGFKIEKTYRNWEIFPKSLPPSIYDLFVIRMLNILNGSSGNVFSTLARK